MAVQPVGAPGEAGGAWLVKVEGHWGRRGRAAGGHGGHVVVLGGAEPRVMMVVVVVTAPAADVNAE